MSVSHLGMSHVNMDTPIYDYNTINKAHRFARGPRYVTPTGANASESHMLGVCVLTWQRCQQAWRRRTPSPRVRV